MKTRSAQPEPPNIAAIVKARHHARTPQMGILFSTTAAASTTQGYFGANPYDTTESHCEHLSPTVMHLSSPNVCDEIMKVNADEKAPKPRSETTPKLFRGIWTPEDRRLFFQAVRIYGRNFNEITRFMGARSHRTGPEHQFGGLGLSNPNSDSTSGCVPNVSQVYAAANTPSVSSCSSAVTNTSNFPTLSGNVPTTAVSSITAGGGSCTNANSELGSHFVAKTREQVRFFYQQTWHKIRRYIKFPDEVPQYVREVYALVNYSVLRARIKKPVDHRLGERLNELVHCGTTVIKHNGKRFVLRTPVCQSLKQLNNICAPIHEFLLPEDVWIELVPRKQADGWRVVEAEQNPRLRLRVDINRQLYDVMLLAETKWKLAAERIHSFIDLKLAEERDPVLLMMRLAPIQAIDGAICLQEVARIRPGEIGLRSYMDRMNFKIPPPIHHSGTNYSRTNSNDPGSESTFMDTTSSLINSAHQNSNSSTTAECFDAANPSSRSADLKDIQSDDVPVASSSMVQLDLRVLGKLLSRGVTRELAREIKILSIYLALGCPERIRFEYEFVVAASRDTSAMSNPYYGLLTSHSSDPDGDGLSNGLRRLLHLNASDYLLHRDWVSRHHQPKQSITDSRQKLAVPPKNHTPVVQTNVPPIYPSSTLNYSKVVSSTVPPPVTLSSTNSPLISHIPMSSVVSQSNPIQLASHSIPVTNPQLSTIPTSSAQQNAVLIYPNSQNVQLVWNADRVLTNQPINSTVCLPSPPKRTLTSVPNLQPTCSTQPPKLVLLPQSSIGPTHKFQQVPIVERRLDHEKPSNSSVPTSSTSLLTSSPIVCNAESLSANRTSLKQIRPKLKDSNLSHAPYASVLSAVDLKPRDVNTPSSSLQSIRQFHSNRRTTINQTKWKTLRPKLTLNESGSSQSAVNYISGTSSGLTSIVTSPTTSSLVQFIVQNPSNYSNSQSSGKIDTLLNQMPQFLDLNSSAMAMSSPQIHGGDATNDSASTNMNSWFPMVQSIPNLLTSDTMDELLLVTETNQSTRTNDTLASLLNTIYMPVQSSVVQPDQSSIKLEDGGSTDQVGLTTTTTDQLVWPRQAFVKRDWTYQEGSQPNTLSLSTTDLSLGDSLGSEFD